MLNEETLRGVLERHFEGQSMQIERRHDTSPDEKHFVVWGKLVDPTKLLRGRVFVWCLSDHTWALKHSTKTGIVLSDPDSHEVAWIEETPAHAELGSEHQLSVFLKSWN